jgi:hypothetical protein
MPKKLQWFFTILFVVAISPPLYLSLNTPFALIDDYTDWIISGNSFKAVMQSQFASLFELSLSRTRPMFDLLNYFTWNIFGDRPWAHHLFRWALKVGAFALIFFSIKNILIKFINKHTEKDYLRIIFFLPLFVFFLSPNNPDARLAPVELELSLFLALLFFSSIKIIFSLSSSEKNNWYLLFLYVGAIGVIASKETGFVYAFMALAPIFICAILLKKNQTILYLKLAPILSFTMWSGYSTFFKLVNDATPYGNSGLAAVKANALGLYKVTLLTGINPVLQVILLAPIAYFFYLCIAYFITNRKEFFVINQNIQYLGIFILIVGELLASILMALLSPLICVRYIFPLLVPYTIIIGLTGAAFFSFQDTTKKVRILISIASCWALFCIYGATVSQYGIQYSERNAEKLFLADALRIATENQGKIFIYSAVGEYKDKAVKYLTWYRQHFYGDFSITAVPGSGNFDGISAYRVSSDIPENPGVLISHNAYVESNITLLANKFSKIFGASGKIRFDCGSSNESDWKIFKK